MKRTVRKPPSRRNGDDLRPEYDFSAGVRGKHATGYGEGTNVVLLDPDVAAVYRDPATVNEVLRALAPFVQARSRPSARKRKTA